MNKFIITIAILSTFSGQAYEEKSKGSIPPQANDTQYVFMVTNKKIDKKIDVKLSATAAKELENAIIKGSLSHEENYGKMETRIDLGIKPKDSNLEYLLKHAKTDIMYTTGAGVKYDISDRTNISLDLYSAILEDSDRKGTGYEVCVDHIMSEVKDITVKGNLCKGKTDFERIVVDTLTASLGASVKASDSVVLSANIFGRSRDIESLKGTKSTDDVGVSFSISFMIK